MTDDTTLANLAGVPDAAKDLWGKLIAEELRPVHELFKEVRDYQHALAKRSQWTDDDVDPALARDLAEASLRLLGTLSDDTPESTRRLIQAAVRYFIIEDDADGDLDSILGLDDDAEVVNAVLRHLGHDKWLVQTQ
ncbi:MAG: hypothetical protein JRI68_06245 [Deltaproteobacteria bacterium]|nr:hypothetical protein [Deltaproteobacteria bacterium]